MGTNALPWAFLSCTLRNTGSPVQIAMADPLVVRRVITDPFYSIFHGDSLVLCLDLAMRCDAFDAPAREPSEVTFHGDILALISP
jgi:hypothetical protein